MTDVGFWIDLAAIALSPLIAVQVSEFLARQRQAHARKVSVFQSLMVTRAERVSPEHVRALNSIDLEFSGTEKRNVAVRAAWKAYLDHLDDGPKGAPATELWIQRGNDLMIALLRTIGESLDYSMDSTDLRRAIYRPVAHNELELEQTRLRKGLLAIIERKASFPVSVAVEAGAPSAGTADTASIPNSESREPLRLPHVP